jgi:galactofuranosylgalactofuranosylrhamnosyl-N-acetylglucosaminyl-diphospho-decaprenol beta-1,5/1,6-galactofuranosyltransferase
MKVQSETQGLSGSDYPSAVQRIALTLVICTFHREEFVLRNLSGLEEAGVLGDHIEVLVIDNSSGESLSAKLAGMAHVRVIPQGNLGGAGGFTRGIYEAMKAACGTGSTEACEPYVLLMDDDIEFDPEVVRRTLDLLANGGEKLCIAGQLYNIHPPHDLFEAGATFGERKPFDWKPYLKPTCCSASLKAGQNEIDYGGWWYFCFPLKAVGQVGLPLPIFIRGDDVDYGRRWVDAGYRIISPDGIGVRHETFDARYTTWIYYYETRNALICLATSYKFRGWGMAVIWKHLEYNIGKDLGRFDYGRAAVKLEGIRDFLRGAESLDECEARHREITALYAAHSLQNVPDDEATRVMIDLERPPRFSLAGRLKSIALKALRPLSCIWASEKHVALHGKVFTSKHLPFNTRSVLFCHTPSGKKYFFRHSADQEKRFLKELSQMRRQWADGFGTAEKAWQEAVPRLTSFDHWEQIFASLDASQKGN